MVTEKEVPLSGAVNMGVQCQVPPAARDVCDFCLVGSRNCHRNTPFQ